MTNAATDTAPGSEIDKVALICLQEGRILVARSKGKDRFYIPGGKREGAESDRETLVREVREELSADIVGPSVAFLGEFAAQAHGHPEGVQVRMRCYVADLAGDIRADNEIAEVAWFAHDRREDVSFVDGLVFDHLLATGRLWSS